MTITTPKRATPVGIIIQEIQGTMDLLREIIHSENTPIPVPEMTVAQCQEDTVTVMVMVEAGNPEAMWTGQVVAPTETHLMVTVTLAAPHLQGAPHHPMVGAVEAVVTMTLAPVPGMAMAVVTVTPAVGVSHIHLAVVSEWAGRRGAQLPLLREATLLVIRTAAQVVEGHVAGAVAIGLIEGWLAADTELDLEITFKANRSLRAQLASVVAEI